MKKISFALATIMLFSLILTSCGSITFFSSSKPVVEKVDSDFKYTATTGNGGGVVGGGEFSKVIISDGSGIYEDDGDVSKDYDDESDVYVDDNGDGNPDDGNDDDNNNGGTPPSGGTVELKGVKVGDYIMFGVYEQDNNLSNGKEAIEWLVLDVKDGRALVISKYALDQKSMHTSNDTISWETCWIRGWLNNDFINAAFSDAEKSKIALTSLAVDPEPEFNDPNSSYLPGNPTSDKVFFLSVTEAERYFANDDARVCLLTPYAATKNVNKANGYADWWLRNGGSYWDYFSWVSWDGYIFADGINAAATGFTIRPAMWIEIG